MSHTGNNNDGSSSGVSPPHIHIHQHLQSLHKYSMVNTPRLSPVLKFLLYQNLHKATNEKLRDALVNGRLSKEADGRLQSGGGGGGNYEISDEILRKCLPPNIVQNSSSNGAPLLSPPPEFIPLDPCDDYWPEQINGFKAKFTALKSLLGSQRSSQSMKMALIHCHGNEEKALEGLLSGEKFSIPPVPESAQREHYEKYQEKLKKYQQTQEHIAELKRISPQEMSELMSNESLHALMKKDPTLIKKRKLLLKNETAALKKRMKAQRRFRLDHLQKMKSSTSDSGLSVSALKSLARTDRKDRNRIFIPGEYQCYATGTIRLFPFFPERTFSPDEIPHFRIAEASFYRFMPPSTNAVPNNARWKVTCVQYVVNPSLRSEFDACRLQEAKRRDVAFEEVTPYLLHGQHRQTEDEIKKIVENGYERLMPFGATFKPTVTRNESGQERVNKVILSLVLPSRGHALNNHDVHRVVPETKYSILPYYIVTYEDGFLYNSTGSVTQTDILNTHLDEHWKNFEENAKTDKEQNDMREFYKGALQQRAKEKSLGEVNGSDLWFQKVYAKKYEEEKKFRMGDDEPEYEIEFPTDDEDDTDMSFSESGTPVTGISEVSVDVFNVDSDGDDLRMSQE